MTLDAMQQTFDLGFGETAGLRGFRLERLEVYNWGTFDGKVFSYELGGKNSLLTGDIGSGKSTLVDAVTTLLVPAQRVQYNRAAGADKQERSLRSYFLGYYKSTRGEVGPNTRPVAHRNHNGYSVILGNFHNRDFGQQVTLAQVFWMKESGGQPTRFYTVVDRELRIAQHFCDFEGDMKVLRKRLRTAGADLFDSFPPYSAAFRRRFGLATEQALELFHQTVSMKAVGNLTDFVREHMLEKFDVEPRIEALMGHYDNLNRAHEAVLKARAQVEALTPLVADCDRFAELLLEVAEARECRDTLRVYFNSLKAELLERRLQRLAVELERLQGRLEAAQQAQQEREIERRELQKAIADNGGDRLQRLEVEIETKAAERQRRQKKHERYLDRIKTLGWNEPVDADEFAEQRRRGQELLAQHSSRESDLENEQIELEVQLRGRRQEHDALEQELKSLRSRRSNIHQHQVEIRSLLCRTLNLPEAELAFVGELLQVKERERDWEGAAERLLHNFALSLLVPDRHYQTVADWVDQTRLRGRLVYYRVLPEVSPPPPVRAANSLVHKLEIKPDTPHFGWLDRQLKRRFDVACCDNLADFRREPVAITRRGQIKSKGERHEKDDRHDIDDRSRYVLGWTNEAKILVLEKRQTALQAEVLALVQKLEQQRKALSGIREQRMTLKQLEEYRDFREIDWRPLVKEVATLEQEKQALESASNVLQELTRSLRAVEETLLELRRQCDGHQKELGAVQQKIEDAEQLLKEATATPVDPQQQARFGALKKMCDEALGEHKLTVESCANREQDMREWLTRRIDNQDKQIQRCRERILRAMSDFCHAYPLDTQELDVDVRSGPEFAALLERLNRDDLPRFEERFKQLLNENTIREIANFQSQLNRERETIRERVELINGSLRQIDYNPGRYIVLELQRTTDVEIRDFQNELRACTEGALTGSDDEQYSEQKFLKVRDIIERFKGREGMTDLDRRWTRKVTDVRQWFTFSASERWKADHSEHEHYADSGGKSGGQKEKLAYTVLAASLSYQFGLEAGATRSRTFHFVVIDEAFSRSSDESTSFGLELFKTLDLQLMIVTPLQKIHIIEPYVASVGFCHTDTDTFKSAIQNLTIEEYRRRKQAAIS